MKTEENKDSWSENPDTTIRWLENQGKTEREAVNNPQKAISVIGMYVIYLPCLLITSVFIIYAPSESGTQIGLKVFFGFLAVLSFLMMFKSTKNYIKYKHDK